MVSYYDRVIFRLISHLYLFFIFFFYLHWIDDDGKGRVVPLAASFLSPAPGTLATAMDGANSEHTKDHHDNQETHTHHYDDGGCSWHHCTKKKKRRPQ